MPRKKKVDDIKQAKAIKEKIMSNLQHWDNTSDGWPAIVFPLPESLKYHGCGYVLGDGFFKVYPNFDGRPIISFKPYKTELIELCINYVQLLDMRNSIDKMLDWLFTNGNV